MENTVASNQFWMVYLVGESGPTYRHATYDLAKLEAIRLMKMTNKEAIILEAVSSIAPPKQWVETSLKPAYKDEMPF